MKPPNNNKGFSLAELMVAMAIFSIVVAGVVSSKWRQSDQHITQVQAVEMQQSIRAVADLMKRRLRKAGFDPYRDGSFDAGITAADTSSMTFSYVDTDTDTLQTITYALSGSDLTENGIVLAENVSTLTFTYNDTALDNITGVDITITVVPGSDEVGRATDYGAGASNARTITTSVNLRNMGF